jgi:hypothetical protein
MDHMFKVRFVKGDAVVTVDVEIENDLLIALAKGKVDNADISNNFFRGANVSVRYHGT